MAAPVDGDKTDHNQFWNDCNVRALLWAAGWDLVAVLLVLAQFSFVSPTHPLLPTTYAHTTKHSTGATSAAAT